MGPQLGNKTFPPLHSCSSPPLRSPQILRFRDSRQLCCGGCRECKIITKVSSLPLHKWKSLLAQGWVRIQLLVCPMDNNFQVTKIPLKHSCLMHAASYSTLILDSKQQLWWKTLAVNVSTWLPFMYKAKVTGELFLIVNWLLVSGKLKPFSLSASNSLLSIAWKIFSPHNSPPVPSWSGRDKNKRLQEWSTAR